MITLLEHEILRTRGQLGAIAAILGMVGLLGVLLASAPWGWVAALGAMAAVTAIVLVVPAGMAVMVTDYWQSSYGRGAVLTHSLPIEGRRIFAAKFVHGCLVMVAALAMDLALGLLFGWAMVAQATPAGQSSFGALMGVVRQGLSGDGAMWASVAAALIVLNAWGYLAYFYFSVSVGKEPWAARMGAAGPIVVAVVMYVAMQLLMLIGLVALPWGISYAPGAGFSVVPVDVWGAMARGEDVSVVPLGVPIMSLAVPLLMIWRTARSWSRHVSIR